MDFGAQFGVVQLNAGTKHSDICGANGLPVTPNSITLLGNFKALVESVEHPNLVQYIDCFRGKHEKVSVVFEAHASVNEPEVNKLVRDLLNGLFHLHYNCNYSHGNITPNCVVECKKTYLLNHWAYNIFTDNGELLDTEALLPDDIRYLSPERCVHLTRKPPRKSDVWSLGLVVASYICKSMKLPDKPMRLARCSNADEVIQVLGISDVNDKWRKFLLACLEPEITKRATTKKLFEILDIVPECVPTDLLKTFIRYDKLTLNDEYNCVNVKELYYLFCLASPGHKEPINKGISQPKQLPILNLPLSVTLNSTTQSMHSPSLSNSSAFSFIPQAVHTLNTMPMRNRIAVLDKDIFLPLVVFAMHETRIVSLDSQLPLVIRENDFAYQCERLALFKALVEGSPYILDQLIETSKVDVNPFYRASVWASLLDIKWSALLAYEPTDKITATSTDRQISVDIPRCHQYNDLLASSQGHIKLTRVLKAWLKHNENIGYVYWQGLDSLAAPFVILNFDRESRAFACFNAFIHKYLRGFFNKDNSATIQEYLALFSHLIAFHDPQLFNHLDNLGFTPELYAIPWFLTMFTHVLPLHKTIHLWDTLLLGDESFPLCVGVAILLQLRNQLLSYSFNDCILIFSDLPEINIEGCVKEALRLAVSTPKSAYKRDLTPLLELRNELSARIDMKELIGLHCDPMFKSRLVIVDMRPAEQLAAFGPIANSSIGCVGKNYLKESLPANYYLIVIVNDTSLAESLVRDNVNRVCSLMWNETIPKELQA